MNRRPQPLAVLSLCVALAACGGDDDAADSATTTPAPVTTAAPAPTTTEPPPTTTEPAPTTAAPTTTAAITEPAAPTSAVPDPAEILGAALLTADDINSFGGLVPFVDYGWEDSPAESPCGGDPVDVTHPDLVEVGVTVGSEAGDVALLQEIHVYDSSETAGLALEAGLEQLSCGATPDGTLTFDAPVDVTTMIVTDPEVGPEEDYSVKAIGFAGDYQGTFFVVRYNDAIITFQFVKAPAVPEDQLPAPPVDIVSLGLSKVFSLLV